MTSRRLIRIKVLQLLYAFSKKENSSLAEIERDLLKSISKSTDLYYETLLLITEIRHKAFLKHITIEIIFLTSKHPFFPPVSYLQMTVYHYYSIK